MIDLCIDARMAFSSGIGTFLRKVVPRLDRGAFHILLLVAQKGEAWCDKLEQKLFKAPIYSIREQLLFPSVIPRCDIFWSPHYNIPLLPIRAKKRLTTIHDACHLALQPLLSFPQRIYAKKVMRKAVRNSDAIATDSDFSRQELQKFIPTNKKWNVIYPGVEKNNFSPTVDQNTLAFTQNKYHLPPQFILYVGNLKPHKNLQNVIQALEFLPNIPLVIVGKSFQAPHRSHPNVLYLGEVPESDLPNLYRLAEVFVFPSLYEGFGLPPLEAMGCGCPAVVSTHASLPEVCGEGALYFDPTEPQEIARVIQNVIQNPQLKTELIEKGRKRIEAFDWDQTARGYMNLFQQLAEAK
jgi:glycosyltransferase involved in cell wall biosynthesis